MSTFGPRSTAKPQPRDGKRRLKTMTRSFDAGEIDERALHRTDTDIGSVACKRLRNWAIVTAGAVARRPGTWHRAAPPASETFARAERVTLQGAIERTVIFGDNSGTPTLSVLREDTWAYETAPTLSAKWTSSNVYEVQFDVFEDSLQVVHQTFWPLIVTRSSAGVWTGADLEFDSAASGEVYQPYFRYADRGITLAPSALTGSITLELDPDSPEHFTADHVGVIVRYHDQPVTITAVTDGDTVTATVTAARGLYPTRRFTIQSTDFLNVGDSVQGDTTNVEGVVSAFGITTVDVVLDGYTDFQTSGTPETLTGPNGFSELTTAIVTNGSVVGSTDWDEAMISSYAGYPGATALHKGRNMLAGFPKAGPWIAMSVVNSRFDFNLGSAALDDAVLDGIGGAQSVEIYHLVSATQLIVLTDIGPYYVPESADLPISQTSIAFDRVGNGPPSRTPALFTDEGVIYSNDKKVYLVAPTGNVRNSWGVSELATLASHLISSPVQHAMLEGLGDESSRYLIGVNTDGSLCVLRNERGSDIAGWARWHVESDGASSNFLSVAARENTAVAVIQVSGLSQPQLGEFDWDAMLDLQRDYSAAITDYANATGLTLIQNNLKVASGSMDSSGQFVRGDNNEVVAPASGLYVGWDFTSEFVPLPPTDAQMGAAVLEIRGVKPRLVETQHIKFDDEVVTSLDGYDATATAGQLPLRSWTPDALYAGDSGEDSAREPTITLSQDGPGAVTIAAITWHVAYGDD